MSHTTMAELPTAGPSSLAQLFARLLAARCEPLTVNPYIVHEPVQHGDCLPYSHVHQAAGPDSAELLELPVSYSDYGGSDLDAANLRALVELCGEDVFVHLHGGHGSTGLALPFGRELPDDDDHANLTALVEAVEWLCDHPFVDEDVWSQYVDELAETSWAEWLRREILCELESLDPDDGDTDAVFTADEEALRAAYFGFEGNEWVCDTATTVVNNRHTEAVRHVAATLFGWS